MHISVKIRCFKAITHSFKAFKINLNVLNRPNEIQVCSIQINVTNTTSHLPQRGSYNPHSPPWLGH